MSATRDPDLLLQAFLDEGPEVLPDRALMAIADDVHRLRQRTIVGPWRLSTMRTFLASAAVVAIVIAGVGIFIANRAVPPPAGNDSSPSPSIAALPAPEGDLDPGTTYDSGSFTHAFAFTVPATMAPRIREDIWDGSHTFRIRPATGGAITIHDGNGLPNDLCDTTGALPDLPNVEEWLAGSEGLTVSPMVQLTGSVLSVRYWDIELGSDCYPRGALPGNLAINFSVGEHHRLYEVQVGTDTMLVVTWGSGYGGVGDDVLDQLNALTDELVRSFASPPPA
jgi:hypothetical protein